MNVYRSMMASLRWSALGLLVFLIAPTARADCSGVWDLSGAWTVNQGGVLITFNLEQTGAEITGTAQYNSPSGHEFWTSHSAVVAGSVTGRDLTFTADWDGGATSGEYTAVVDDQGSVAGTTFDRSHPEVTASWQGVGRQARCVPAAAHCDPGYVWRDNFDGDTVCVRPDERHRLANGTCSSGYVWRDTFDGDTVCVTPAQRDAAKAQKRRDELGEVTNRPGAAAMDVPANPAPAAPPQAQPPAVQMATANDDVDIYQDPGQGPIIGTMAAGTKAPVLGHEPGWYKLQLGVPGGSGWVAEDHLTIGG